MPASPIRPPARGTSAMMAEASRRRDAGALVRLIEAMAADGRPLMTRVIPAGAVVPWDHFPEDDARDPASGCRWYYHVHAPGDRPPDEHGHFHLFLPRAAFGRLAPLAAPPYADPDRPELVHLAGLSVDQQGVPIRWFATNRHVTDEWLYPALDVASRLSRFRLRDTGADPLVDRFLTLMVRLFRAELRDLLVERDAALLSLAARRGGRLPVERGHDVLAVRPLALDAALDQLLE